MWGGSAAAGVIVTATATVVVLNGSRCDRLESMLGEADR
jgi:hypothetical protein